MGVCVTVNVDVYAGVIVGVRVYVDMRFAVGVYMVVYDNMNAVVYVSMCGCGCWCEC